MESSEPNPESLETPATPPISLQVSALLSLLDQMILTKEDKTLLLQKILSNTNVPEQYEIVFRSVPNLDYETKCCQLLKEINEIYPEYRCINVMFECSHVLPKMNYFKIRFFTNEDEHEHEDSEDFILTIFTETEVFEYLGDEFTMVKSRGLRLNRDPSKDFYYHCGFTRSRFIWSIWPILKQTIPFLVSFDVKGEQEDLFYRSEPNAPWISLGAPYL